MSFTLPRNHLVIIVAIAALLLSFPATATADHGGTTGIGSPDNADHYIDRFNLTALGDTATQHGINQLNRSDMNATLSGTGDVDVYDGNYGNSGEWNGVAGKADCIEGAWLGGCDIFRIRFNQSNMSGSTADWRWLGCHEFGHTADLGHRSASDDSNDDSCMRTAVGVGGPNYDFHDINEINSAV